jgi:hypothetical protein
MGLGEFLLAAGWLDGGGGHRRHGGSKTGGGGGLLARGITAFSTTAVSMVKRARLKVANSLVRGSTVGSSFLALMASAFEEASIIRA